MHARRGGSGAIGHRPRATGVPRAVDARFLVVLSLAACTASAQVAPAADAERERRCATATLEGGERLHEAFGRGCIAKRRFVAGDAAPGGSAADASRAPAADGVFRLAPVEVVANPELPADPLPSLEQRFTTALVNGNPEVAGGKIRHGAYYAHGVYWGWDPLSFLYLNIRYGLFEP